MKKKKSNNARINGCDCTCKGIMDGQGLNLIAVSFASILSENLSVNEITVLSVFFTMLADALDTIVTVQEIECQGEASPEIAYR